MSGHTWRSDSDLDPFREWARRVLPGSSEGLVISDIDTIVRRYGKLFGSDDEGMFEAIERKRDDEKVTKGEQIIYGNLDYYLRNNPRWKGCHLLRIRYTKEWPSCPCCGRRLQDADLVYDLFCSARLEWNEKPISHKTLEEYLLAGWKTV